MDAEPSPDRFRLVIGASGAEPVQLLDGKGVDLFERLPISALHVELLPGEPTKLTVTLHPSAIEATLVEKVATVTKAE